MSVTPCSSIDPTEDMERGNLAPFDKIGSVTRGLDCGGCRYRAGISLFVLQYLY